ncbi:hypothetical protein P154DRAFT_576552 [Amniculicola lignicola CBS 123094]|uniref:Uncharacterized protein n=1 Tax=Amniculicola lignicola CBS 123094 TaxID=1392246 RepID=A0A6A5WDF1_9PLEO|nr:hypothetical protein P154DRAFT_576552 [Amniculicola lignicola CBS 123094]
MPSPSVLFFAGLELLTLAAAAATSAPHITWLESQRSAIVKLDTPGYPLWIMDKARAPILYKDAEPFYVEAKLPSALLLNLTISPDKKTLFLNHQAILPLADSNVPPMIEAYQVPANISKDHLAQITEAGLLNRKWEGLTLGFRYLALDYDRLVWSDPASKSYINNVPVLKLRVLGLGAHSRSDVLKMEKQMVLHVTLTDTKHGKSDAPDLAYAITDIRLKSWEDTYDYVGAVEGKERLCTKSSWRCEDVGLYSGGAPWYRYIWRERFDQFGRVGSGRHAWARKIHVLSKIWEDAGASMVMSWLILMGAVLFVWIIVVVVKKVRGSRERTIRGLAEEDRLLGEDDGSFEEDFLDDEKDAGEIPPPLPPRPAQKEEVLIDLEAADGL